MHAYEVLTIIRPLSLLLHLFFLYQSAQADSDPCNTHCKLADSIEIMIEKLREGVGEDAIEERDLVYYDNETTEINPLANIRTDKEELRLDEQISKYKF